MNITRMVSTKRHQTVFASVPPLLWHVHKLKCPILFPCFWTITFANHIPSIAKQPGRLNCTRICSHMYACVRGTLVCAGVFMVQRRRPHCPHGPITIVNIFCFQFSKCTHRRGACCFYAGKPPNPHQFLQPNAMPIFCLLFRMVGRFATFPRGYHTGHVNTKRTLSISDPLAPLY